MKRKSKIRGNGALACAVAALTFASASNSFAGVSVSDVEHLAGADSIIINCEWNVNTGCTCDNDIQQPRHDTHLFDTVAFDVPNGSLHSSLTATGVNSNDAIFVLSGSAHAFAAKLPNVCGNQEVGGGSATAKIAVNLDTAATMHVQGTLTSSPPITPNQSQYSQADFYVCDNFGCYEYLYYKAAANGTVENFDDTITLPAGTFRFGFGGTLDYLSGLSSGAGAATYSYVETDQDTSRDASWEITVEITEGSTPTPTPTPNISLQMQRGASYNVFVNREGGIDDPLIPTTDSGILVSQPLVSAGVVADGVTPLLFKFVQRTAGQASYTVTIDNPTLAAALHLWDNGYWSYGNTVTFDGIIPTGFAYIDGLTPDVVFLTGQTETSAVLTLTNTANPNDVITTNFKVRRPPILLVHGYHSDGSTWTQDFQDQLLGATQSDFIDPVSYGVVHNFNTWGSFAELVPVLDGVLSVEEASFHENWAFTRYDVVAHSQGGILTRLLCRQSPTDHTVPFKDISNFNRGRFRRVITIGSPHNGSTMAYYVSQLLGHPLVYSVMPDWLRTFDPLQPKFDPFGDQIHAINDASANVDPDAKFRAITDTINGGDVPPSFFPPAYSLIGLTLLSIQHPSQTRGEVVLSTGSDGIVDIESERGGVGTPLTEIQDANICHLRLCPPLVSCTLGDLTAFVFGTSRTDTSDPQVALTVATLLTGPSDNFGAFQRPVDLTVARKTEIDGEIPIVSILNLIVPLRPIRPAIPRVGTTSYTFMFTPDPNEPLDGPANWYAEVFSPDGVTTGGLTVTPDPLDSTHVTVDVDASVLGDVALYLSYNSTTGHLIFGSPVLVTSIPPGANLTGIELLPDQITATVGDVIGLGVWGLYDNGSTSQLFVQPDNTTFASSNPSVASVDSGTGVLSAVRAGDATITATYASLASQITIHVLPVPRAIPTPRPAVTPRLRPTPPPHLTPVPPPPSPRPTAYPRPTPPPHLTPAPSPTSPRPTAAPRPSP